MSRENINKAYDLGYEHGQQDILENIKKNKNANKQLLIEMGLYSLYIIILINFYILFLIWSK